MKPLSPSLKAKKRYLSFKIISDKPLGDFLKALKLEIASYFGQKGLADSGLQILREKLDIEEQTGLIKIGHKYVNELKTSLILVKELNSIPVLIRSVKVSGILNKAVPKKRNQDKKTQEV